jgi:BNR/Asp-box repeat
MRRALLFAAILSLLGGGPVLAAHGDDVNAISDDVAGVDQTDSPRRQQPEPSIAIDRQNTQIIAAGAQDFRRARELRAACGGDRWNGLYLSTDGGQTWSNELVPGFCTDTSPEAAESQMFGLSTNTDPVLVFDDFGNLYYSHIAFNADPFRTTPPSTSGVLFVSSYDVSSAGAEHLETVAVPSGSGLRVERFLAGPGIVADFDDKQWMTVDNSPTSPHYGRVYVTWTKFGAQGGVSSIWISHCGGDTPGQPCTEDEFSRGHPLNKPVPGGLVQESFPAVAPNGDVYVAFLQFQGGFGATLPHSGVWVAKSTDGGETFTQQKVAAIRQIPSPIPPAGTAANDGNNSFRTGTVPSIGVTSNGAVHLVWGEWTGADAEVRYVRSTNGGQTWSPPIGMSDTPMGHQFFPSLVTEGTGVHVAWYDSRLDSPAGGVIDGLDVFYNRSTNAGASFEPDLPVTDHSFDPNAVSRFPVFCAAFIGDYIDIDAVDGTVAVIWNDNREVTDPLTPEECADFQARSTDPAIQGRLDSGALDLESFVDIVEQP